MKLWRFTRRAVRLGLALAASGAGLGWLHLRSPGAGAPTRRDRALWLQRSAGRVLRSLDVRREASGPMAGVAPGIRVANHVGCLDVLLLAASEPVVFVAKREVADWPILGRLVRAAGTLFVDRTRRADVGRVVTEMRDVLAGGLPVVFFPEGTSTEGDRVGRFHSSLFTLPAEEGWPVTPVALSFRRPDGTRSTEAAYWGDVRLLPHLAGLCAHGGLTARVDRGPTVRRWPSDRKLLAAEMQQAVLDLLSHGAARTEALAGSGESRLKGVA